MKAIFIIHGTLGYPEENWFPWLREKLEDDGHKVFIPQFPTPEDQSLDNRYSLLDNYKEYINKETIFVGHSLWALFILHIAEKYKVWPIVLVAGFLHDLWNKRFDNLNTSFTNHNFNREKIQNNISSCTIYQSDNDPYIPMSEAETLAKKLNTTITLVPNAWHFNTQAWYTQFEQLYNQLKTI